MLEEKFWCVTFVWEQTPIEIAAKKKLRKLQNKSRIRAICWLTTTFIRIANTEHWSYEQNEKNCCFDWMWPVRYQILTTRQALVKNSKRKKFNNMEIIVKSKIRSFFTLNSFSMALIFELTEKNHSFFFSAILYWFDSFMNAFCLLRAKFGSLFLFMFFPCYFEGFATRSHAYSSSHAHLAGYYR